MSFVLYVVVLVVSVSSVMMGLDWLSTPPPPVPKSVQTVSAPAKPVSPAVAKKTASKETASKETASKQPASTTGTASSPVVANADAAKSAPAKPDAANVAAASVAKQPDIAVAAPETAGAGSVTTGIGTQLGPADSETTAMANAGDMSAAPVAAAAPRCDVQACSARYHSFSASDCTYQPFDGPRRLCTVGNPPRQADAKSAGIQTSDARQPPASSSCNYQACASAYHSFDAATCTWLPFEGARRLCEK